MDIAALNTTMQDEDEDDEELLASVVLLLTTDFELSNERQRILRQANRSYLTRPVLLPNPHLRRHRDPCPYCLGPVGLHSQIRVRVKTS
jgi:hypothetical protein